MIRGIGGAPYINLDKHLNIPSFLELHPEICKGFAMARDYAKEGTWMKPGFTWDDASYIINWKPIYQAVTEYLALPLAHPIRVVGDSMYFTDLSNFKNRNTFTRYLKMAMGANDPYIYYFLWDQGDWNNRTDVRKPTEESQYFPGVVEWVNNLVSQNIISQIGRVIFFHCDHNGLAFEHRDLDAKNGISNNNSYSNHRNEFIHIRFRTKRGFYVWDPDTKNKHYINSHASFWNDEDWHGGEVSNEQEYALRIDCKFTKQFRNTIGIGHLTSY
jgi:hypothetical protein